MLSKKKLPRKNMMKDLKIVLLLVSQSLRKKIKRRNRMIKKEGRVIRKLKKWYRKRNK